jgi:hypothetical protein
MNEKLVKLMGAFWWAMLLAGFAILTYQTINK